jgi:hypothetical protein
MDVKIPSNLAAGDYLLRAEAIALHAVLPAHCDRRRIRSSVWSIVPRCIQSHRPRYPDQHIPESQVLRRARPSSHRWRYGGCCWSSRISRHCYGRASSYSNAGNYDEDFSGYDCGTRAVEWGWLWWLLDRQVRAVWWEGMDWMHDL